MAFAISELKKSYEGSYRVLRGKFTSAVGDAAGEVSVKGMVFGASFISMDADAPAQTHLPFSKSVSNGVSTLTVGAHQGVTEGRFEIRYK